MLVYGAFFVSEVRVCQGLHVVDDYTGDTLYATSSPCSCSVSNATLRRAREGRPAGTC